MQNVSANITVTRSPEDPNMIIITDNDTGVTYDPIHISQVWELFNESIINVIMGQLYAQEEAQAAPTPEQGVYPNYNSTPHNRFQGMGGFGAWTDAFHAMGTGGFDQPPSGRLRLDPNNDNIFYWYDIGTGQFVRLTRGEIDALRETNPSLYQEIQAEMMMLGNARWYDIQHSVDTDFPLYEKDPGGLYAPELEQPEEGLSWFQRRREGMGGLDPSKLEQVSLKRKRSDPAVGSKKAAGMDRKAGMARSTRTGAAKSARETPRDRIVDKRATAGTKGKQQPLNKRYQSAWERMRGGF